MSGKIDFNPLRLSVLASRSADGAALARLPIYAQVGWYSSEPVPPPETRLARAQFSAIRNADPVCESTDGCPATFDETIAQALAIVLPTAVRDSLAGDLAAATDLLTDAVKLALETGGVASLADLPAAGYRRALIAALRAAALLHELDTIPAAAKEPATYPLGLLATDHVGYLSFDLERLPEPVRASLRETMLALRDHPAEEPEEPARLWLYPLGLEALRVDALAQRCFAADLVLARLELPLTAMPPEIANLGILALQNPGLADWRVSPGSFAQNPGALVGADGCETILPANLATHEFHFHQVIGVPASEVGLPIDVAAADKVRPGFVNEYRVRLIPIGHSLGQILYTFGLAPGESVNFAVIDWTRRDTALRTETTKLNESLVHELRRDRIISETVRASIEEWQHGNSSMSGLGASLGGAIGGSGMGAALGLSGALGATSSTSRGSRDIAADTVQRLSDNIVQASASSRELNSTVVVQSAQAEHEAIETRTIVNYNHSHALTVVYYEVLRHFRLVTEFVRRRPALLTNIHGGIAFLAGGPPDPHYEIFWPNIYENRAIIQAALLDDRFKDGLDLVERHFHRERATKIAPPPIPMPAPAGPPPPPGPHFRYFVFEMKTGGLALDSGNEEDFEIKVHVDLNVAPGFVRLAGGERINPHGSFYQENFNYWFAARMEFPDRFTIPWGEVLGFHIFAGFNEQDDPAKSDISFSFIRVVGIDDGGGETVLFERDYQATGGHIVLDSAWSIVLPARRPPPLPPPPPLPGRPQAEIDEEARFQAFTEHLLNRRPHYERALRLNAPPAQRAFELANFIVESGRSLLEKVDNRPLEVLGDFVAYPCVDPDWSDKIMAAIDRQTPDVAPVEQLITFPTRGVFAEAKLGHCNASEEIDNTRFWDWQQSPIPHLAPEIAPVQPVKPGTTAPTGLQPTGFPSSLLNIVNPPAAPDPTGMGAALTALATANIFRDMSGRGEIADLLKKLGDNSVAIAGTAQKAATGGAGTGSAGGGGSGGGIPGLGPRATPVQPSSANRDLHDLQGVLGRAQSQGLISPEAAQQAYGTALGNALGDGGLDLRQVGDAEFARSAQNTNQLIGLAGERIAAQVLRAEGMVVFVDWRKHVAGGGADLLALKPAAGGEAASLWLVDNKAQMRGVSGAEALTAEHFGLDDPKIREFLNLWPDKAEGAAAIAALDNKRVKLVVSNAWAGETTRFTKAVFDKGLHAYDVRLRALFTSHADWTTAFAKLPRGIGMRRIGGSRGFATVGASLVTLIVASGATLLLTSGSDVRKLAYEAGAQVGLDLLLSRLPGGLFASMVIGLKSDNAFVLDREEQIDEIARIIPDFESLPAADQKSSRDAIKELIENPVEEEPGQLILPEFNFDFRPSLKL